MGLFNGQGSDLFGGYHRQALLGMVDVDTAQLDHYCGQVSHEVYSLSRRWREACISVYKYYTNMLQNLDNLLDSRYNTHH